MSHLVLLLKSDLDVQQTHLWFVEEKLVLSYNLGQNIQMSEIGLHVRQKFLLTLHLKLVNAKGQHSLSQMIGRCKRSNVTRCRIFSCVRPFYERTVSNLDSSIHRSLWV